MKITVKEPTTTMLQRAMNDSLIIEFKGRGFFKVHRMTWTTENVANGTCDVELIEFAHDAYAWT